MPHFLPYQPGWKYNPFDEDDLKHINQNFSTLLVSLFPHVIQDKEAQAQIHQFFVRYIPCFIP